LLPRRGAVPAVFLTERRRHPERRAARKENVPDDNEIKDVLLTIFFIVFGVWLLGFIILLFGGGDYEL